MALSAYGNDSSTPDALHHDERCASEHRAEGELRTTQETGLIDEIVLRDNRRRILRLFAAVAVHPLLALPLGVHAAAAPQHLSFRALRNGSAIGVHTVSFQQDRERLVVTTRIDISVKVLFFTAFYLKHE